VGTGLEVEPDHPAGYVSWNDAIAFCDWLSRKENKKYRLPTEAEWEYACRAGTNSRYYCGNNPEQLTGFANVADADRAAEIPGKPVDTFDRSGKKTGKQIPYPFLSGHDGYAWTAPVGRFRPNSFWSLRHARQFLGMVLRLVRRGLLQQIAGRGPSWAANRTVRVSRGGAFDNSAFTVRVRVATAARRSRVTAMTVSASCASDSPNRC